MRLKLVVAIFTLTLAISGCSNKVEERPLVKVENGVIAPAIEAGKKFQIGTLKDQFDRTGNIDEDAKKVIMVFAKSTGHLVKDFLNTKPKSYLDERKVIFIADVSKMPSMIFEYVALPDLQKYKYPIYLILDESISKKFRNDRYKDYVMIIDLDKSIIKKVRFVTTTKDLEKIIN